MQGKLLSIGACLLLTAAAPFTAVQAQAVALQGGTMGVGGDFSYRLSPLFSARAKLYGGSISRSADESGVHYEGKIKLNSAMALVDLHPFSGNFRVTAGLMLNNNKAELTGRAKSGTIEINNVVYNASDLGTLNGKVSFNKSSPYLGIGWGSALMDSKGFFFSADIGAAFVKPRASLTGTCNPSLPQMLCDQLQNDIRAEQQQFTDAVADLKVHPLLAVGVGYRF